MLYLAEVKVQNRGFVGGYKTELKLLASQGADQTWNRVVGEEIVTTDAIGDQSVKGTLYIVNVDNKQVSGTPELAGSRIVNYFAHFSRTLEKSKEQEIEIEEWKTSLRIQGEEIAKRQAELDQVQQLLQQQEEEFTQLEKEKENLSGAWEELREQQRLIAENKSSQGEIQNKLNSILGEFSDGTLGGNNIKQVFSSVNTQQQLLDKYWQSVDEVRNVLQQKQQELGQKKQYLEQSRQELQSVQNNLQKTIVGLQSEQTLLQEKEEFLRQLNVYLEAIARLDQEVSFLADDVDDMDIDFQGLESMPLGNLEEIVNTIQQETAKLVNFVNLQEEELTLQGDEVKEIQGKLDRATEMERYSLETELADSQEAMKLLNETLVGQRRTLKKQQKMLNEHFKILSRRKGVMDVDFGQTVNLKPMLGEIETQRNLIQYHRDKLNQEVTVLRQSASQVEERVTSQKQQYEQQVTKIHQEEEAYLKLYQEVAHIESQVKFLDQDLHPIQEQLNSIRSYIQSIEQSNQQFTNVFNDLRSMS
ncbi:pilus motility taxis protein HmpF [Geminocystis herdmanii]|uniref:pilus motility taxis protein HmpF n=1 Tax=Geminocystis herdmanii TaxID=669359 RepID=UPI0011819332|nr:pilus motility taxis protein HmpF [Geminocystis herdmanii]